MFQLFVDSIRPLIGKFETELQSREYETACQTIHKARGAVANAGGKELAGLMGRIEAALVARDFDEAGRETARLRPGWTRLLDAIAAA
jgi:HPt (histidine-containing phosphotransfer) domain-containing protein